MDTAAVVDDRGPLWCEGFDGDLYALLPEARPLLAPLAAVRLLTRCKPTNGRVNCPAAWNTRAGMASFAELLPIPGTFDDYRGPQPEGYVTSDPLVECTAEELVRDLWLHGHALALMAGGKPALTWTTPARWTWDVVKLLHDARGHFPLDPVARDALRLRLLGAVLRGAGRILAAAREHAR